MKHMQTSLLTCAVIGLFLLGCVSPEQGAYRVIGSTATTVEAARQSWVAYVTQQRVILTGNELADLEENVARGSVIYGQYQQAMKTAKAAVVAYKSAPADSSNLNNAMSAVSAAAADFIALVNQIAKGK
jgi:hypothetical protein